MENENKYEEFSRYAIWHYEQYGNLYTSTPEEVWEKHKKYYGDIRSVITADLDALTGEAWLSAEEELGRTPTFREYLDVLDAMFRFYGGTTAVYLWVLLEEEMDDLKRDFLHLVSTLKKTRGIKRKNIRTVELERYLQVYDLRNKGLKWKEVHAAVHKGKHSFEDRRHVLLSDKRKAETIIMNVFKDQPCSFFKYPER